MLPSSAGWPRPCWSQSHRPGTPAYAGTGDLDLHLSLQLMDGEAAEYYRSVIAGLRSLNLAPDERDGRTALWRWVGRHRGANLEVELLCPSRTRGGIPMTAKADTTAEVNVGPSGEIKALALGLGHLVTQDTENVERRVETQRGWVTYPFPVAGGGDIMAVPEAGRHHETRQAEGCLRCDLGHRGDRSEAGGGPDRDKRHPLRAGRRGGACMPQRTGAIDQFLDLESGCSDLCRVLGGRRHRAAPAAGPRGDAGVS